MAYISVPTSLTTTSWTGVYTYLGDANDASYIESPTTPVETQTFLCGLGPLTNPGVLTGHTIRVRTKLNGTDTLLLKLQLENTSDSSVVASHLVAPTSSFVDQSFDLTEAEAGKIISYSALQIRGYGYVGGTVFVWYAVSGATSYVLQIGPSVGTWTTYNSDVGNVLTATVALSSGTYYSRVVPVGAGFPTAEQTVVVT